MISIHLKNPFIKSTIFLITFISPYYLIKCALADFRRDFLGPHEVGHKDVATGSGVLSL